MAYVRKQGQAIQTPGYQTGGGMLGSATTGTAQPSGAGQPGGWTNIQDYLSANKGDTTNIDTAKQQTAQKIQTGANSITEQKQNVSPLPDVNEYSAGTQTQALADDDYGVFEAGYNQQGATDQIAMLPGVNEEIYGNAPLENRVDQLSNMDTSNFNDTMSFVGDLSTDPNYSPGSRAFDTMLLQGSPEFRQDFVPQVQQQYQALYQAPLEQARTARGADRTARGEAIAASEGQWGDAINSYLGTANTDLDSILARQQAQEAAGAAARPGAATREQILAAYGGTTPAQDAAIDLYMGNNTADMPGLYDYSPGSVNRSTAIGELGTERAADYSGLANVIGSDPLGGGAAAKYGTWGLNTDRVRQAINNTAAAMEQQSTDYDPGINNPRDFDPDFSSRRGY